MANRLNTFVHVVEQDDQGNTTRSGMFGPDDVLPEWAVQAISNPDVWAEAPAEPAHPVTEPSGQQSTSPSDRPKGNASRSDWAAYAIGRGIQVADGMSRDEIVAAVDQANVDLLERQV